MKCSVVNSRLQCGRNSEKGNQRSLQKKSLDPEKSLECDVSQQRQERLTGTRKDRTLYLGVSLQYVGMHAQAIFQNLNPSTCVFSSFLIFISSQQLSIEPCLVQFSHSVVSNSLQPHGLQHARLPCPSPIPGAYSNSCPLSQ